MTLKKIDMTKSVKLSIDKEIQSWFQTRNVSLFTFRYNDSDLGYIFLAQTNNNDIGYYAMHMITLHSGLSEKTKIEAAFQASPKAYSVKMFDGFVPSNVLLESAPLTYKPNARPIIAYILAGYSLPINPNLISSWGYEAVY
jgi:hypothetical protein